MLGGTSKTLKKTFWRLGAPADSIKQKALLLETNFPVFDGLIFNFFFLLSGLHAYTISCNCKLPYPLPLAIPVPMHIYRFRLWTSPVQLLQLPLPNQANSTDASIHFHMRIEGDQFSEISYVQNTR